MSLDLCLTQGTLINGQEVGWWLWLAGWFETVAVCHCGFRPTNPHYITYVEVSSQSAQNEWHPFYSQCNIKECLCISIAYVSSKELCILFYCIQWMYMKLRLLVSKKFFAMVVNHHYSELLCLFVSLTLGMTYLLFIFWQPKTFCSPFLHQKVKHVEPNNHVKLLLGYTRFLKCECNLQSKKQTHCFSENL